MSAAGRAGRVQRPPFGVLGAVAVGGMVGATARYGIDVIWPRAPGAFPWAIFAVNVSGCALIGALMAVLSATNRTIRLAGPFLATGVLGGFTTFSTYAVDVQRLVAERAQLLAIVYLVLTPVAALVSVATGNALTRWVLTRSGRRK